MGINEVDLNSREDLTFRFRSADKLLEYQELENTEIYFCPFDQEDDVLEGALNLYWQADEILWTNFFAHYFLVFFMHYSILLLEDEEKRERPKEILWQRARADFKMEGLIQEFLNQDIVQWTKKIAMADNHKVRPEELRLYFKQIHPAAVATAGKALGLEVPLSEKRWTEEMDEALQRVNWEKTQEEGFFRWLNQTHQKIKQVLPTERMEDWKLWLLLDFPDCYFDALREMVFPKWYIASFCKSCTNTRNWAQYGDYHKGICLIFRTHPGNAGRGIRLKTCHSYSSSEGRIFENNIEPLKEVRYDANSQELNFFETLGSLTGIMLDEWCHGSDGECSKYYRKRGSVQWDEWHRRYWQAFAHMVTCKGGDWDGLAEERIVLENLFFEDYDDPSNRKIQYDFEELEGIIWGCATTEENKKKIRDQIAELCKKNGRDKFQFYQAVKDPAKKSFIIEREW